MRLTAINGKGTYLSSLLCLRALKLQLDGISLLLSEGTNKSQWAAICERDMLVEGREQKVSARKAVPGSGS